MLYIKRIIRKYFFYIYKPFIIIYRKQFKAYGSNITWGRYKKLKISSTIRVVNKKNIILGSNIHFDEFVHLICSEGSILEIGNNVRFANGFQHVGCSNSIKIGNNVLIAAFVQINDGNHNYKDIKIPIMEQGSYSKGSIIIGNNVWIGHSSHILSGVSIGDNVTIGAASVVTKNIPSNCVIVGNPARIIKKYNFVKSKWE